MVEEHILVINQYVPSYNIKKKLFTLNCVFM